MDPDSARRLISLLSESLDIGVPVRTLPEDLRDADLLTVCDADGLIEFGRRRHCQIGRNGTLVIEPGWDFGSITGPNNKPMAKFLKEEILSGDHDPRIEILVRLTHKGRIEAARHALGSKPKSGESSAEANAATPDFTPTPDDLRILRALEASPTTLTFVEIESAAEISRKTVGLRVRVFHQHRLVHEPRRRKGITLTNAGRALLEHIRTKSTGSANARP